MGGNHEFKFGFGFKNAKVNSITVYGGNKIVARTAHRGNAQVWRDTRYGSGGNSYSGWLGDTFTKDRLTFNVGLRFDHQTSENPASSAEANPVFPTLVPGLDFDGGGTGTEWNKISPRVGITYALDEGRKTVLRASYAQYAGQIPLGETSSTTRSAQLPRLLLERHQQRRLRPAGRGADGCGTALLHGHRPQQPERRPDSPNMIDPNYKANIDHEFVVGIDHELFPNFAISAAYTYRKSTTSDNTASVRPPTTPRPGDTVNAVDGDPNTANSFSPNAALVDAGVDASTPTSRATTAATWARSLDDQAAGQQVDGPRGLLLQRLDRELPGRPVGNPSQVYRSNSAPGPYFNPQVDGGQVSLQGGGSGKAQIYSSSKWTISANALYQLGWGIDLSGAVFGRQGSLFPVYMNLPAGRTGHSASWVCRRSTPSASTTCGTWTCAWPRASSWVGAP